MSHSENYDELADRLTSEASVKSAGKALHGEEAKASGRQMIAAAIGIQDFSKEDLDILFDNQEFINWICDPSSQTEITRSNIRQKFLKKHG